MFLYTYRNDTTLGNGTPRKAGETVDKNDIIPTGTVICVKAVSKGSNYIGEASGEYSFKAYDIFGAKVTIPKQTYTGRRITLDKTDEKQILVRVKRIENYAGTKTVKFTIKAKGFSWWWN